MPITSMTLLMDVGYNSYDDCLWFGIAQSFVESIQMRVRYQTLVLTALQLALYFWACLLLAKFAKYKENAHHCLDYLYWFVCLTICSQSI